MQSTGPSGARRIWARMPALDVKRPAARSISFRLSTVSRTYWTVRSNSFSESARVLPISHMRRRTDSSRTFSMPATKARTASTRAPTLIVGHGPRPWSHARTAASSAESASSRVSAACGPMRRRSTRPSTATHTGEVTSPVAPVQRRTSPSTR